MLQEIITRFDRAAISEGRKLQNKLNPLTLLAMESSKIFVSFSSKGVMCIHVQ